MARIDADRIREHMESAVEHDVGGLAWAVSAGDTLEQGAAGWLDPAARTRPMPVDGIFRIASVTKPIAAVAALQLVDEGLIGLDDPVDGVLPELAGRRVLVDPNGPVDGPTVAATRPLTLRDLLSFRCGFGMDFTVEETPPLLDRLWELGIGPGPKGPDCPPDEFMSHFEALPLADQPGTKWRYHVGSDLATVLVERVRGERFDDVLAHHVCEPLGMVDTVFTIRPDQLDRFGATRMNDEDSGELQEWDQPEGQWAVEPPFHSGAAGLVSTTADLVVFGRMLLDGGVGPNGPVLSATLVAELMRDQLTDEQRLETYVDAVGTENGWGLGGGVRHVDAEAGWPSAGAFGWDGGLGSHWVVDPATSVCAVLLTTDAFDSPGAPKVIAAFDPAVGAALR